MDSKSVLSVLFFLLRLPDLIHCHFLGFYLLPSLTVHFVSYFLCFVP